jgi:hypothetical protein
MLILPGLDVQRFFTDLGQPLEKGRPDRTALNTFGRPWGVEFLGPPLSLEGR